MKRPLNITVKITDNDLDDIAIIEGTFWPGYGPKSWYNTEGSIGLIGADPGEDPQFDFINCYWQKDKTPVKDEWLTNNYDKIVDQAEEFYKQCTDL